MVFSNNLLFGAAAAATSGAAAFDSTLIGNSVWLDGSADLFTKSSFAGHASKKVISVWVQRTGFSAFGLIRGTNSSGDRVGFGDNVLNNQVYVVVNGKNLYSNRNFRDIGWYHYLVSFDLTQSVAVNKVKVYINGVDLDGSGGWQTDERSTMSSSFATFNSSSVAQQIGRDGSSAMYLNAYLAQYCELDGQSIQSGDVAVSDFLDTFTFGTNGSQFIPKKDSDIAALATTAGGNSFCLDFSTASVALSSGVTPTSNAGTFSGSLSNLTDGDFTTEWRSTVDPATNVSNDHVAFDLGSAKNVKAVKVTGRSSITGNFKVQFSDNGSDFTDTGTTFSNVSITSTANSGILDLTSDNPGSHRYWKLINISNSSGTSAWGFKQIILASTVGNLGTDASGNDNDFTLNSIDSNNQSENTPSKVYPWFNPLTQVGTSKGTFSEGNTKVSLASDNGAIVTTTLPSSGMWYWEIDWSSGANGIYPGIALQSAIGNTASSPHVRSDTFVWLAGDPSGRAYNGSSIVSYVGSATSTGRIAVAFDADNTAMYFGTVSGSTITWLASGDPTSGSSKTGAAPFTLPTDETLYIYQSTGNASVAQYLFDEDDWTGSTNRPANAKSLNSANLTAPEYQGIDYFNNILYEGNGQNQRVGNFVPFTDTYAVDKSAMFDDGDRRYLARTYTASDATRSSNSQATISYWIKFCSNGANQDILTTSNSGQTDRLRHYINDQSGQQSIYMTLDGPSTNRDFEIPISKLSEQEWTNIVYNIDVDNSTAADKIKCWVNGVQQTSTDTSYQSASNADYFLFDNEEHFIGNLAPASAGYTVFCLNSYLAEMHVLDGQLKPPTDFGQVDTSTNRWVAKDYKTNVGAYGNRGFYMAFDNATGTGNGVGTDSSGNGFNFTESFVSGGSAWATSDQFTDTPSQNFDNLGGRSFGSPTISDGNTLATIAAGGKQIRSNFNLNAGKWYVEVDIQAANNSASVGLVPSRSSTWNNGPGRDSNGGISYESDGDVYSDNVQNATAEASYTAGDVVQMAIDMNANKIYFGKNNTFSGDPAAGTGGHFLPASILSDGAAVITLGGMSGSNSATMQINYGQFLVFDGGSTTNGFKYTPPTGFQAVNQDNLDDTASKITAWAWIKNQDATDNHMLFDRVRGVGEDLQLFASSTVAEATDANTLQRFLQRGVQVGNDAKVNTASESYTLWQWLLGDSATTGSTNDSGSINSTVIAADAGHFSVGTFTGAGGSSTIGHGLSAAPEFFLVKRIGTSGTGWFVYNKDTTDPNNKYLRLQTTAAEASASGAWTPGATTMGLNESSLNGINTSGVEHLFIAFRSVSGVCKVGSFVGNFSHDGPYIHLGFKPSWYMTKDITTTSSWYIYDSGNYPFNSTSVFHTLANTNDAGGAGAFNEQDFLSDGVKNRGQNNDTNASGSTFIYLAMADIGGNGTLPPIYGR